MRYKLCQMVLKIALNMMIGLNRVVVMKIMSTITINGFVELTGN